MLRGFQEHMGKLFLLSIRIKREDTNNNCMGGSNTVDYKVHKAHMEHIVDDNDKLAELEYNYNLGN